MADDIFDQIIDLANNTPRFDGRSTLYGAAAEIRRLRAENAWYKAINAQLQSDLADPICLFEHRAVDDL